MQSGGTVEHRCRIEHFTILFYTILCISLYIEALPSDMEFGKSFIPASLYVFNKDFMPGDPTRPNIYIALCVLDCLIG